MLGHCQTDYQQSQFNRLITRKRERGLWRLYIQVGPTYFVDFKKTLEMTCLLTIQKTYFFTNVAIKMVYMFYTQKSLYM